MSYINKGSMVATVTVSHEPDRSGNFVCDGIEDGVTLQAALNHINALGGGIVHIGPGTYVGTNLALSIGSNTILEGEGYATRIVGSNIFSATITVNTGSHVIIRNMFIDGVREGLYVINSTDCRFENLWIESATTFSLDGLYIGGASKDVEVVNCTVEGACGRHGIHLWQNKTEPQSDWLENIYVKNCKSTGATECGLAAVAGFRIFVLDSVFKDNTQHGINFVDSVFESVIMGNDVGENAQVGIYLHEPGYNIDVIGNKIYRNGWHGIDLWAANDILIEGNHIYENDYADTATYDGIAIAPNADDNFIIGNSIHDNDGYEVRVYAVTCERNIIMHNDFKGTDRLAIIRDDGTDTILASKPFQFTEVTGGTAAIQVTSPVGCYVSDAGGTAIAWGQLPIEVQQVVKLKVWAVAKDGPVAAGGQMHCEFTFNAGASNAAYNTVGKSWNVVNKDSEEADYVADDVVHWVLTDTDTGDSELSALVAGDRFEILAIYESATSPDGDTDAKFSVIEIEYV